MVKWHRHYNHEEWALNAADCYRQLCEDAKTRDLWEYGYIRGVADKYKIPSTTVRGWRDHVANGDDWLPWECDYGNRAVFTEQEKEGLVSHVKDCYITPGKLFVDEDFRELAVEAYVEKLDGLGNQSEEAMDQFVGSHPFSCSKGFIYDFKQQHDLTSKRAHYQRRSPVNGFREMCWKQEMQKLFREVPEDLILNCDETSWQVYPRALQTWAEVGSETVGIVIDGDEKACLTAHATISAAGEKLPLLLLAEGKTPVVETTQIGDVQEHWKDHTPNGWQTEETFMKYLLNVRLHKGWDCGQLHLLVDLHKSHNTEHVKYVAGTLDIVLHWIPASRTGKYQPLDVGVFGVLKAGAKRLFRKRQDVKRTKLHAVEDLLWVWDQLSPDTIRESWDLYREWAAEPIPDPEAYE
jgi:hypothetical protein